MREHNLECCSALSYKLSVNIVLFLTAALNNPTWLNPCRINSWAPLTKRSLALVLEISHRLFPTRGIFLYGNPSASSLDKWDRTINTKTVATPRSSRLGASRVPRMSRITAMVTQFDSRNLTGTPEDAGGKGRSLFLNDRSEMEAPYRRRLNGSRDAEAGGISTNTFEIR